ncbi:MAG: glutaredoxin family protein [Candidatus Sericytochromatia bacterium]
MNKVLLEIYSKENCELCDKLKEVVNKVHKNIEFDIKEIDITKDPEIFEKYKYDIPVVHLNGIIAFKHRITEDELIKKLSSRKF